MKEVIFDSSFLIAIVKRPTTWYEDIVERIGRFEPVALECVIDELRSIAKRGGKRGRYASLALEFARSFKIKRYNDGDVDEQIINYAIKRDAIAATIDRDLIKELKGHRLTVITLRSGRVELR